MSPSSRKREPAASSEEAQAAFGRLIGRFGVDPDVQVGSGKRGFGADALHCRGRIFAMLRRGRLVLKLPAERVTGLVASGAGVPFDAGKGKPMREWIVLTDQSSWEPLAQEALRFARETSRQAPRA